jgi:hypothetical protein
MAYTPGFKYDLFVSFAHDDNRPWPGRDGRGWVEVFVDYLACWLQRRGLKGVTIWLDRDRLTGATEYDPRIQADLGQSLLLVALHSHNYRQSAYCEKELGWFHQAARAHPVGPAIDGERRVFNVLLNNIPRADWKGQAHWTGQLEGATGFPFHDAPDGPAEAFGDPLEPGDEARYQAALKPIVDAATKLLRAARRTPEAQTPAPAAVGGAADPKPAFDPRPRVFIADVPEALIKLRKQAINALADRARLLPPLPPPATRVEHAQACARRLGEADLSVHLLAEQPGRELDDAEETFPRCQCDLARAAARPALIWLPEALDLTRVEDEAHRDWLAALEAAPRPETGWRIARGSPVRLIEDLKELIDEVAARRPGGERLLVIDPYADDQMHGFELAARLKRAADAEGRPLKLELTRDGTEPPARWTDFEQLVQRATDLIVLFGAAAPTWVHGRVERAVKLTAAGPDPAPASLQRIWVLKLPGCRQLPPQLRFGAGPRIETLDNAAAEAIADATVQRLLAAGTPP